MSDGHIQALCHQGIRREEARCSGPADVQPNRLGPLPAALLILGLSGGLWAVLALVLANLMG